MSVHGPNRYILLLAALLWAGVVASGCSDDGARACSTQEDCFLGEECIAQRCVSADAVVPGHDISGEDVSKDADAATDSGAPDSAGADATDGEDAGPQVNRCEMPGAEATCSADPLEMGDSYTSPILLGPNSVFGPGKGWCDGFLGSSHAYDTQLCGYERDIYRIFVDNRSPNTCIAGAAKITATVTLGAGCDREFFDIFPYWNSGVSICDSDPSVECQWSGDNREFQIVWSRPAEQTFDALFSVESSTADIKLDYQVKVKVEAY